MFGTDLDKWRNHPVLRFTGIRDLKFVFPGFGIGIAMGALFFAYDSLFGEGHHHAPTHFRNRGGLLLNETDPLPRFEPVHHDDHDDDHHKHH